MAEGGEGEDEIQFLRTVSKDGSVGSVCVWRAPPPVSISTARCGGGERSFAPSQMQDASYFIKFAGEASRMAVSQEPSHQATGLWCGEC